MKLSPSIPKQSHLRRCHVCGVLNELSRLHHETLDHSCAGCGKHLAPFYFFEESVHDGVGDNTLLMSLRKESIGYQPLWGLTAYWPADETG